ncbi:MAG TPA: AI-2E family transporter [Bacteroidetes bacterium]|nr:AI-2E family transporter [Bacteroidota bacterium]
MTKTLISLATGLIATIILIVFGVDFAVVWGMLTFLLNYIPNIGSIIATAPPILVAFLQFDSFLRPLWITVLLLLVQMAMGNIIEPKFMGKSLDLSPLVVILFLIFWGFLWGIVGMILAVPIAATIKIVTANFPALRPVSVLMSGN